ncbi:PhzF family isomerase [Lapidilactobacillus wuchangensis]|uniref:PhzF family isomerase n=1 Tax=Lapidilactobacillus wuchangensis TaxID=2486001 RepID=UPI000F7BADB8|nr:PhzF family isomerase [Lapidilactobacillus wuchangensis]
MKTYQVYQVDAFTTTRFTGNPAGVVTAADDLTTAQMQQIARELNNSETAFICQPTDSKADLRLRFFTPTVEVPFCGHATIAAQYINAREHHLTTQTLQQQTQLATLPVMVDHELDDYRITMTLGAIKVQPPLPQANQTEILLALGLTTDQLNPACPIAIAIAGAGKVMIGVKDQTILNQLQPDLTQLRQISQKIGGFGYYVFTITPETEVLIHGRMFNPAAGINEDPVTGNANGPLGAYLVHYQLAPTLVNNHEFTFTASQGEQMQRPGFLQVRVQLTAGQPTQVQVTGQAVVAFKTTIEL